MNTEKTEEQLAHERAYQESLANLRVKRLEARKLARSGHPGRRAQGQVLLASLPIAFYAVHRQFRPSKVAA